MSKLTLNTKYVMLITQSISTLKFKEVKKLLDNLRTATVKGIVTWKALDSGAYQTQWSGFTITIVPFKMTTGWWIFKETHKEFAVTVQCGAKGNKISTKNQILPGELTMAKYRYSWIVPTIVETITTIEEVLAPFEEEQLKKELLAFVNETV
ncbi:MAG: hypothetical protein UW45_C0019G0025 [Parcubacteria group bacterium GW2011_GWC2_44_22]|nr:MAG: hypothetical protein UW45_C0019G0025 [Parcubacteria group bacterium GW2011_GWC2_44_22]